MIQFDIEKIETDKIILKYNLLKENMEIVDDDFNNILLSELSNEYLTKHIADTEIYLCGNGYKHKYWAGTWLNIYQTELLRRRTIKIKKIKKWI